MLTFCRTCRVFSPCMIASEQSRSRRKTPFKNSAGVKSLLLLVSFALLQTYLTDSLDECHSSYLAISTYVRSLSVRLHTRRYVLAYGKCSPTRGNFKTDSIDGTIVVYLNSSLKSFTALLKFTTSSFPSASSFTYVCA